MASICRSLGGPLIVWTGTCVKEKSEDSWGMLAASASFTQHPPSVPFSCWQNSLLGGNCSFSKTVPVFPGSGQSFDSLFLFQPLGETMTQAGAVRIRLWDFTYWCSQTQPLPPGSYGLVLEPALWKREETEWHSGGSWHKKRRFWEFSGGLLVRILKFHCLNSIPCQETEFL